MGTLQEYDPWQHDSEVSELCPVVTMVLVEEGRIVAQVPGCSTDVSHTVICGKEEQNWNIACTTSLCINM